MHFPNKYIIKICIKQKISAHIRIFLVSNTKNSLEDTTYCMHAQLKHAKAYKKSFIIIKHLKNTADSESRIKIQQQQA